MSTVRFLVTLEKHEIDRLIVLARKERRTPHDQAAHLIASQLRGHGELPATEDTAAAGQQWPKTQRA